MHHDINPFKQTTPMIKKFLILASIACLCLTAWSQVSNYTSTVQTISISANSHGHPICNWNDQYSLAFLRDANGSTFVLIDHSDYFSSLGGLTPPYLDPSLSEKHVFIPNLFNNNQCKDLIVRDIYIVDNYAFFCGTVFVSNDNKWHAIYGYLDLYDLENTSTTTMTVEINVLNPNPGFGTNPDVLDRLVAYKIDERYDIVAFGDDMGMQSDGHFVCASKIVEIQDVFNNQQTCDVAELLYIANGDKKQFVDDIFLTDNYVVFTRHDRAVLPSYVGYILPCVSFAHKGMVVQELCDPNSSPNYYLPNLNIPNYEEGNDTVVGTAITEDLFAIAYIHYEENPNQKYTRIRTIDPSTLSTSNDIQFKKYEKENPIRMIYYPEKKGLVLLQHIRHISDFAVIEYPNNNTPLSLLNIGYSNFKSLQRIGNQLSFISTNSGVVYLQNPFATFPPSTQSCPDYDTISIEIVRPTTLEYEMPMTMISNLIAQISESCIKGWGTLKPICTSVE